jgi:acyl-CoA dehydrogenase
MSESAPVVSVDPAFIVPAETPGIEILRNVGTFGEGEGHGPTEVHKITLARQLLKQYQPVDTLFPSGHIPTRRDAARAALADRWLEHEVAQL